MPTTEYKIANCKVCGRAITYTGQKPDVCQEFDCNFRWNHRHDLFPQLKAKNES